jgi:hypothetical protein
MNVPENGETLLRSAQWARVTSLRDQQQWEATRSQQDKERLRTWLARLESEERRIKALMDEIDQALNEGEEWKNET